MLSATLGPLSNQQKKHHLNPNRRLHHPARPAHQAPLPLDLRPVRPPAPQAVHPPVLRGPHLVRPRPPSAPSAPPPADDSADEPPQDGGDAEATVEEAAEPEAEPVASEEPAEADPLLAAAEEVAAPEPAEETAPEEPADDPAPAEGDTLAEPTGEPSSDDSEDAADDATPAPAEVDQTTLDLLAEKEAELERLHMENARLRQSVVGATEVIQDLEEPPMPPLVEDSIVIAPYIVSDFVRLGKQLDRDHLVRATMGSLAMIHPEQPGVMISTKHMVTLPRMNERSLCAAPLGSTSPRGAPAEWHVLEVLLASVSMVTGGPAAVIHMHGPHTTAASCEQDLVLLTPIDELGKQHIGKIIIVDPDPEHPEDYLRQVAEALNQGGMRCVVVRGNGAYAVGADFDQAWANAAMLEHSMQIHLLARQANLKI